MIVVIGSPCGRIEGGRTVADGLAAAVAMTAAGRARTVQIVGRLGDDASADAVLQDLTRHHVGHVAILRDAAYATPVVGSDDGSPARRPRLEAADVELALRYLTEFNVLVVLESDPAIVEIAVDAAAWGGAALVIEQATPNDGHGAEPAPAGSTVVRPADGETHEAFALRVATTAVDIDTRRMEGVAGAT